jgi:hypothetical protein
VSDSQHAREVAERLRQRYPRSRVPRPLLVGLIALGSLIALGWLVWAAYAHSHPVVDAQVVAYTVKDDHSIAVTVAVERRDPARPAICRVVAQATDFQIVGEQQLRVPAGSYSLTNLDVTLVTLRRATTAVTKGCVSQG